jgi:hypothetical protein
MHPAYIRHTALNDITVATSSIDASVRLDPTRQRLVVAQLSLNARISSTACDVRTRHARSLASTHRGLFYVCRFVSRQFVRLPVRQFVSRQPVNSSVANPPTRQPTFLYFFSNVCMRVSVSAFHGVCRWSGVVLYGAPGLSKYTLNGVTGNGISWGGPQAGSIGVITQERVYRYRKR